MAIVPTSVPKSDIHGIIQFLTLKNDPGQVIHRRVCVEYKNLDIVAKSIVNC